MGGIQKHFIIHSLPVFCCRFAMWDWSAVWGTGLFSFSSSTCAAPDHSEVGGDLKSFSGSFLAVSDAFNLWGIEKRRDKVHLVSRVTTGLWMIYDFKDKGVKNWLFSSSLSWDLHVWIKHTQVMGYSVSQNCRVVYVKPEAFSLAFSCLFRSHG